MSVNYGSRIPAVEQFPEKPGQVQPRPPALRKLQTSARSDPGCFTHCQVCHAITQNPPLAPGTGERGRG